MKRLFLLVAYLTCGTGIALADPATECGGNSQVQIGNCVATMLENVDAAMEVYLGFAMDSARELDKITEREVAVPALSAGQSAWMDYRDAHCKYVGATFGGGSGTGIAINSCRVELSRERSRDLSRYIQ